MSAPTELIKALEEGLEGVTPGPWEATNGTRKVSAPSNGYLTVAQACTAMSASGAGTFRITPVDGIANAAHIARCSPDNIRTLLSHIASQDARIEEMRRALEPFAKFRTAIKPGRYRDTIGENFTASDFEAARAALQSKEPRDAE